MDPLDRIESFSEQGRGVPIQASRPGPALPFSPLVRHAYAPRPRARLGWAQGLIDCAEVDLEAPRGIAPSDPLIKAVEALRRDQAGFVPVLEGGRFLGVVWAEELMDALVAPQPPPTVAPLVSDQIATCTAGTQLVDAVRTMLFCYQRRLPVVSPQGWLLGLLSLSAATAAADRDPAVRDLLETAASSPSLFARPWR